MEISEERIKELRDVVEKEFPDDHALQQVHLARLIIEEKTKGLSAKEYIEYLREIVKRFKEEHNCWKIKG